MSNALDLAALRAHNAQLVAALERVRTYLLPHEAAELIPASPTAALGAIRRVQRAYDATGAVWFKCTDAEMALFAKLNDEMKALAQTFGGSDA